MVESTKKQAMGEESEILRKLGEEVSAKDIAYNLRQIEKKENWEKFGDKVKLTFILKKSEKAIRVWHDMEREGIGQVPRDKGHEKRVLQ